VSTIARVLTAFLFIVCEPEAIGRLGRALADTDGVAEVYTTTGSADFIAVVRVPDLDALATVVTQHIAGMPASSAPTLTWRSAPTGGATRRPASTSELTDQVSG